MHDRAGYYICWGCLVWVLTFYTSPASFLVHRTEDWEASLALAVFVAGVCAIYLNYWVDIQRQDWKHEAKRHIVRSPKEHVQFSSITFSFCFSCFFLFLHRFCVGVPCLRWEDGDQWQRGPIHRSDL